jgi:prophage regulatory protein
MDILLKQTEIYDIVGFQRTKLESMIKANEFPKPIKFGPRLRWKKSTVEAWMNNLEAEAV